MPWIDRARRLPALALTLAGLVGCASQEPVLPPPEHTMLDIYRGALGAGESESLGPLQPTAVCQALALDETVESCERKVAQHQARAYRQLDAQPAGTELDYLPYTREVHTETHSLFPRLANPDLLIYVYPHLATPARAPIPGYTTVIPLYDRVQYRLPGESLRTTPGTATAPSDPPAAQRYHKSSHLEGRPLSPQREPGPAAGEGAP